LHPDKTREPLKIWSQANSHCWALAARSTTSTVSHTLRRHAISSSIDHFNSSEPLPSGKPARALLEIDDHLAAPKLSSDHRLASRVHAVHLECSSWRYPGDYERLSYPIDVRQSSGGRCHFEPDGQSIMDALP